MIRRPYRSQRNRTRNNPNQQPNGPAIGSTITLVATKMHCVFDAPVVVVGIPTEITRQSAGAGPLLPATSVTQTDALTVDIGFAANVVATDVGRIPSNVQNIRGAAGGPLAAAQKTF